MDDLDKEKWLAFGAYVRNIRKEKKISMYSIEKQHDFSRQYWSRIELATHGYALKFELIQKMADILDINYLDLYRIVGYVDDEKIREYYLRNLKDNEDK